MAGHTSGAPTPKCPAAAERHNDIGGAMRLDEYACVPWNGRRGQRILVFENVPIGPVLGAVRPLGRTRLCPADTKMGWVAVCALREVGREPVRHSLPDGTDIVLIRHGGRLLAMSNSCPHKKASLHRSGDIEDLGGDLGLCLRCPKHKNKFGGGLFVSFATGKCTTRRQCSRSDDVAAWAVPTYQTKEEDGVIFVRRLGEHAAPEPAPAALTRAAADEQHARLLAAKLLRIRALSPDSDEYTLQLVEERDRAAFAQEPAAMWHLWLAIGGVSREYTPTSNSEDTTRSGLITLVIKLYSKGEMSDQLARAAIGDLAAVSPPRVTLRIPAFDLAPTPRGLTFNLLAGGTGVAPCLQFLRRAKAAGRGLTWPAFCSTHPAAPHLHVHHLGAVRALACDKEARPQAVVAGLRTRIRKRGRLRSTLLAML